MACEVEHSVFIVWSARNTVLIFDASQHLSGTPLPLCHAIVVRVATQPRELEFHLLESVHHEVPAPNTSELGLFSNYFVPMPGSIADAVFTSPSCGSSTPHTLRATRHHGESS